MKRSKYIRMTQFLVVLSFLTAGIFAIVSGCSGVSGNPPWKADGGPIADGGFWPDGGNAQDGGVPTDGGTVANSIQALLANPPADQTSVTLNNVVVMSRVFNDYNHKDDLDGSLSPMRAFFVADKGTTTDANQGLLVTVDNAAVAPIVNPGDVISITARFFSSTNPPGFGQTMMKYGEQSSDTWQKTDTATPPAPKVVTAAQAASEDYEGVLVTVTGGSVTEVNAQYNNVTIDGLVSMDDHILRSIPDGGSTSFNACVGQTVTSATGFGYFSYSARYLLARTVGDLVVTGSCAAVDGGVVDCGDGGMADHLLLSELRVRGGGSGNVGEFIEIHNPTGSAIDLTDYYIWNSTNRDISSCSGANACNAPGANAQFHWMVPLASFRSGFSINSSDFIVRFPAGSSIGANEYQTIAVDGQVSFCNTYGKAPTYDITKTGTCTLDGGVIQAMISDPFGTTTVGSARGLSNAGEEVILFKWSGSDNDPVKDVDYVIWGDKCETSTRSGASLNDGGITYTDDVACASQEVIKSDSHGYDNSFQRACLNEGNEVRAGSNGVTSNDETSEDLSRTWKEGVPTPGAAR